MECRTCDEPRIQIWLDEREAGLLREALDGVNWGKGEGKFFEQFYELLGADDDFVPEDSFSRTYNEDSGLFIVTEDE